MLVLQESYTQERKSDANVIHTHCIPYNNAMCRGKRSFWDAIPNLRIKTFNTTTKKVRIPSSNQKAVVMTEDRNLFGRLLIVAKVREINLRDVLSYELSVVPYSLAHSDGKKCSTPNFGKLRHCTTTTFSYCRDRNRLYS